MYILYPNTINIIYIIVNNWVSLSGCKHWGCNKADNTCVGCGIIICPICLQEPNNCNCENKEECCRSNKQMWFIRSQTCPIIRVVYIFFGWTFVHIEFRFYAAMDVAVIIDTKNEKYFAVETVESPFVKFVNYLVSKNAVLALFIQDYAWSLSFLTHFYLHVWWENIGVIIPLTRQI